MSAFQFISLLNLQEYTPNGVPVSDEWVVLDPLIGLRSNGDKITAPRGFITDLGSIPRPFRGAININGPLRTPTVFHDWLYCSQRYSRAESDLIFLEAMEARGVGRATRYATYAAVRTFGWAYWNKRKKTLGLTAEDFVQPGYFTGAGAR
jgi:hypothetical protein